tara:strand:- start:3821 stop:4045 length:225 start_codon:yes stop_codon:yes gene_type:complete
LYKLNNIGMKNRMIKYIASKSLQVSSLIVLPICAYGAYCDSSIFGVIASVYLLTSFIQDLLNRDLEKKLHGELY